jgi:hypothetical protein
MSMLRYVVVTNSSADKGRAPAPDAAQGEASTSWAGRSALITTRFVLPRTGSLTRISDILLRAAIQPSGLRQGDVRLLPDAAG